MHRSVHGPRRNAALNPNFIEMPYSTSLLPTLASVTVLQHRKSRNYPFAMDSFEVSPPLVESDVISPVTTEFAP